MKKKGTQFILLLLINYISVYSLMGQTSYSGKDSIAIFYPEIFDPSQTLPSFAISKEPSVQPGIPPGWKLTPFFSKAYGKNIATIHCGTADFYGTGEVTGTLRRNNTSIILWNSDNYGYEKY